MVLARQVLPWSASMSSTSVSTLCSWSSSTAAAVAATWRPWAGHAVVGGSPADAEELRDSRNGLLADEIPGIEDLAGQASSVNDRDFGTINVEVDTELAKLDPAGYRPLRACRRERP